MRRGDIEDRNDGDDYADNDDDDDDDNSYNYNNVDMEVMVTIADYDDDEENYFFDKVDMCDLKVDMPILTCIFFTFNWLTLTSECILWSFTLRYLLV